MILLVEVEYAELVGDEVPTPEAEGLGWLEDGRNPHPDEREVAAELCFMQGNDKASQLEQDALPALFDDATVHNVCHPFDLNHPQQDSEQENLLTDDGIALHVEQDALEDLIEEFGVYTERVDIAFDQEELSDSDGEEDQQTHDEQENAQAHDDEEDEQAHDDVDDDQGHHDQSQHRTKELTDRQRQDLFEDLLRSSRNGKLKRNSTTIIAAKYNVRIPTIQCVWKRAKKCWAHGIPVDVNGLKPKNCGCKKIQVDLSTVLDIPLNRRGTIRSLANALGVNKSNLHRSFKQGLLRRHSNSLKPYLKEANKKSRLQWCVSMLEPSTLPNNPKFKEMKNIIHTDEKWFNGTRKNKTMYMHPDEEDPHRTVQNKNAIHKVMFYSGVTQPRFDAKGRCYFDGKLGLWPFVHEEPAQRRSGNRPRGTPITKTMKVDRQTMRSYMISKLLEAICIRWPREHAYETIWIQQDNAPSHVRADDPEFATAVAQTGLDIRIMNQPANSPNMNCLDLGFFVSLQSLTDRTTSRNMDELIVNVINEYENYNPVLLNRVFLTLQGCMIEVMKDNGGNMYKIPHMNKERLEAAGMLPKSLSCDREIVQKAIELLNN
ncbi:uncharacterized protein [Miscanthus floridulus]|uniref:uncharacterized protein n=1 Tax=Miscanthus floridulus TaxID=154761 RepID=UPI0034586632